MNVETMLIVVEGPKTSAGGRDTEYPLRANARGGFRTAREKRSTWNEDQQLNANTFGFQQSKTNKLVLVFFLCSLIC